MLTTASCPVITMRSMKYILVGHHRMTDAVQRCEKYHNSPRKLRITYYGTAELSLKYGNSCQSLCRQCGDALLMMHMSALCLPRRFMIIVKRYLGKDVDFRSVVSECYMVHGDGTMNGVVISRVGDTVTSSPCRGFELIRTAAMIIWRKFVKQVL
jgi:hypothetical protein